MTRSPLELSILVASCAAALSLFIGTIIAWVLAKTRFKAKWLLEGGTLLALVFPPTVMGYFLLTVFGQRGLGPWLEKMLGLRIAFSWQGAVVAATVAALPFVVQLIRNSLMEISIEIEDAARVDGASVWQLFWQINLRIAWRGVVAAVLIGFLRALGDFGASMMVAGNIPGRTQTLSMALYDAVQSNEIRLANQYVLILTGIAFIVLFAVLRLSKVVIKEI